MKKKYQSKILQAIHEDAQDMHELGIISDERMRYFDEECLIKEPEPTYETSNSTIAKAAHSDPKSNSANVNRISAKSAVL